MRDFSIQPIQKSVLQKVLYTMILKILAESMKTLFWMLIVLTT